MQGYLLWSESIHSTRLLGELKMARVTLYADQMYAETCTARGRTCVVDPATPAATQFHHRERLARQINRAQCGPPLGDIGVLVARNGNALDLSGAPAKNIGNELRIGAHAQEIDQISWCAMHIRNRVTTNDLLRIERRRIMDELAGYLKRVELIARSGQRTG